MFLLLFVISGCGNDEASTTTIRIDGSSTTYPLTEAVAEEFMRANPDVRVTVGESGTGGGFSKFLRAETDMNDASRPITPSEIERADEAGISFIEMPVAYDGIAVTAHPGVDWTDCLTADELRRIWEPNSEVTQWSDVRDGFPDVSLKLYGPGTASGTYDYFTEAVVGESGASRTDFSASEDDNVLVQGVSGTTGALGYFGFAYYENNADKLVLMKVDADTLGGGAECIAPNASTIQTGEYRPLSRPLFVYIRSEAAKREAIQRFIQFYMDNVANLAPQVGYVPLSDQAYALGLQRFTEGRTGTLFGREDVKASADIETVLRGGTAPADSVSGPPAE
ncbi:PstS family phosphate ABC transporter substrate-binding protein [Longibacter salinarum]|uniref:PstS family phosphate ABC transporter substrate-binding protein n=1 Tax=Longibacter salinarum TaxID=1850348 RepID=UPI001FEC0F2C|nr:PstS family phosphate ABC transporter substrate-binding protein [Longibacter salinarum]